MTDARVLVLTPDPADVANAGRWPALLDTLRMALERAGLEVGHCPWTELRSALHGTIVLPLLAWGYHRMPKRWLEQVNAWESAGNRVFNEASVLRWNMDKTYLERLRRDGAPVPPSLYVDRISIPELERALHVFDTGSVVAKPLVSATAYQTLKWARGQPLVDGPAGPAFIQPYLESIERLGEISLLFFDGEFSHAVRKRPAPGDFRVQPEWDGVITAAQPAADELRVAGDILHHVTEDLLYARVDLVRDNRGSPVLIELELIEPDLYLEFDPGGGSRFIDAVARRLRRADASNPGGPA
jgi:hypothetical protein